jgi:hypothetical protein
MPKSLRIDNDKLYESFVRACERKLGPKDEAATHAIIGFEFGGPPDVLSFPNPVGVNGVFQVTSDLLFFKHQPKNSLGNYEVAICTPKKSDWAHGILTRMAHGTVADVFDDGHTADITDWVDRKCVMKGLTFTKLTRFKAQGGSYGVLLCTGVTRAELDYALEYGSAKLLKKLKEQGVFPVTDQRRRSVV